MHVLLQKTSKNISYFKRKKKRALVKDTKT